MENQVRRWAAFSRADAKEASRIRLLLLPAYEEMRELPIEKQKAYYASSCGELRAILSANQRKLRIGKNEESHIAWILAVAYCMIVRAETH